MATYGKLRSTTISGQAGTTWYVQLWKKDYLGSSSEMNLSGEGFSVNWSGQGGTRDKQFLNSECVLNMYAQNSTDEDLVYDIFSKGDRNYYVRIYKNGESNADIWWFGWVNPSFSKIENVSFPYRVNIKATDSIGTFSKRSDDLLEQSTYTDSYRINTHIKDFGDIMGLYKSETLPTNNPAPCPTNNDWFQTSIDWWRNGDSYQSDDPFYLYRTTKAAYREDEEQKPRNYKEYNVLKGALKTFNTNCVLANGKYNFIQPNNWLGNTNGQLPFYRYSVGGDNRDTSTTVENNLLLINGNTTSGNGTILAGSNITFEPAFKGVDATFISGALIVTIDPEVDFTNGVTVGQLEASLSDNFIYFTFNLRHYETLLASAVDSALGNNFTLRSNIIRTDFTLEVKLVSGSTVYYLRKLGNENIWQQNVQADFEITVGRGSAGWWMEGNGIDYNYPCSIAKVGTNYIARSENQMNLLCPQPPITGDLIVKLTGVNNYHRYEAGGNEYGTPFPVLSAFNLTQENKLANGSTLLNTNSSSLSSDELGVTYASTCTSNLAEEQYDLGEVIVGNSGANNINSSKLYNVSYGASLSAVTGFRRGNSGLYANITQLLANQFLRPQTEPLEILQANIFSSSVNPMSLLKYSINNNSSFNYYTFLGGRFSAQSETMSGEWYKINSSSPTIAEEPENKLFSPVSDTQVNFNNLDFLSKTNRINVSSDSLAVTTVAIVAATSITSIGVGSSLRSDIAENQKIKLSYADGSNPTTITITDSYNDSATSLDISSFTPSVEYPIGSILSVAPYNVSTLIQSLTTSGNVNNRSVGIKNIQEMNFLPHDFNLTSNPSVGVGSNDLGGSIRIASATANMYAQKLINKGKTITKVNIFGSANFAFRVYEGFIFNDTTTLVGTGVANTELDITDIVGTSRNYITIEIDVASASQEVYGGYALVINT